MSTETTLSPDDRAKEKIAEAREQFRLAAEGQPENSPLKHHEPVLLALLDNATNSWGGNKPTAFYLVSQFTIQARQLTVDNPELTKLAAIADTLERELNTLGFVPTPHPLA